MHRLHPTTRVEIVFIDYTLPEVRSIIDRDGQVRVYQNTPWVCERRVVTQWDWETVRVDMLPIQTSWREMGGVITTASSLDPGTRVRRDLNRQHRVLGRPYSPLPVNVSDISCPESLREGVMYWCLEKLWQTRTVSAQTDRVSKHRSTITLINGKNKKDRCMTVYRQM